MTIKSLHLQHDWHAKVSHNSPFEDLELIVDPSFYSPLGCLTR